MHLSHCGHELYRFCGCRKRALEFANIHEQQYSALIVVTSVSCQMSLDATKNMICRVLTLLQQCLSTGKLTQTFLMDKSACITAQRRG